MRKTIDILNTAKKKLKENNIGEREARLLLSYVLNIKSDELAKYDEINDEVYGTFLQVLDKRCAHIPYAYIVGHQEFMKLDFKVNNNVLIPRADTEVLVEEAIKICKENELKSILDMCTGSGCIGISLSKYLEGSNVTAVDISEDALEIAKENSILNDVKVDFKCSNLFENINGKYDLIVSNPPYIKKEVLSTLEKEVNENEPLLALDGGEDGLKFYRSISKDAKKHLSENGYLIFEIGFDQAEEVSNILINNGYRNIKVIKDYSGYDRVVVSNI